MKKFKTGEREQVSKKPEHVFLIDGSGFIFRAYYAIKADMTNPAGTPVNAVFGFTKMIMKLIEDTEAGHIAVIFDKARKTFRNDIYPDYKANRGAPPDDLVPQFALARDATEALNVVCVDMNGFEADDLIATYTKQALAAGADVTIVSSDKDLMQLVGPGVVMFDAMKNKIIGADEVMEKFGVGPEKVTEVQALAGDSSDNIPGVAGIGVKTAAQLINEYGDLETLLARAGEIKQPKRREKLLEEADAARLSLELVTLRDDVPSLPDLSCFAVQQPTAETLLPFLRDMGFKSLLKTAEARFGISVPEPAPENEPLSEAQQKSTAPDYQLVQTIEALKTWIDAAYKEGVVAVDTETTSLDAMRAELVGVSLSVEAGRACYIPLGHKKPAAQGAFDLGGDGGDGAGESPGGDEAPQQLPLEDAIKLLKPLLEDASVLKIGQNIKYDMKVLSRHGIAISPIDDTMLLSYVLEGGLHGHGMDTLSEIFLDHKTIKYADVTGTGKAKVTFDMVGLADALDYAAEDADITGRLHRALKPRLARDHMVSVYETLERPLVPVLEEMERTGVLVDGKELKRLSDDFGKRLAAFEIDIHKLAGREFNIGSPKQLGEILFDEQGLPGGKKGKTGAYGTGVDVLDKLAEQGHDLAARVLDWRHLAKLKSTYSDALMEQINPDTGRVHTSYSQGAVATGRLASSNPNLQNIPIRTEEGRKIRRAFVPAKGMVFLSADYSQIELRLLAHVAGIDSLKQAFRDGQDIHAMTASQVFDVPIDGMDPMVRRKAKAINFGIIYGISAFGLARQLGIGNSEAGEYIDAYFEKYPGIRDYMERTKEEAREHGFVKTLFGRKCHIKSIKDKNQNVRSLSERAAINAPIQGGAADVIKRAMIRLPDALKAKKLKAKMLLQVHDELIFEVPEKELQATTAIVRDIMSGAAHLDVPLVVDIGHGANWDEAH
ncbi:MAG: DNA polymerase I [Proteobacteria bacterium]|nr:DNA polymerase I [Pseudomonadota bacterium]MDA1022222.1 DNA polymerase I [Pseudomonadota bacterium]